MNIKMGITLTCVKNVSSSKFISHIGGPELLITTFMILKLRYIIKESRQGAKRAHSSNEPVAKRQSIDNCRFNVSSMGVVFQRYKLDCYSTTIIDETKAYEVHTMRTDKTNCITENFQVVIKRTLHMLTTTQSNDRKNKAIIEK